MLSVKNLVKIYKTKGGVEVRALDGVSIDFPETGMVFLLGRSGSGKSTLLNVVGGLDVPTEGELVVNGKSSAEFSTADFDSYRNTFVGFVFQEYNILEEFTVEQNIALALQLQSRVADKDAVKNILSQVDLKDVEKRKPSTLSGGQRQRIAIARALIKSPKIIMADEPTGALDSSTGEQIFNTLKKLSNEHLVIVVSHDRSFAEQYADRIIELADGKIIQDVTKTPEEIVEETKNVTIINEQTVTVKDWSKVTEKDIADIVSVMKKSDKETVITSNPTNLPEIKRLSGVEEKKIKHSFKKTDTSKKPAQKQEELKFIKSRLPTKHAIRLAFDGIKSKPVRLIFTVLLAITAFVFFGVSTALMLYNPHYSIANALAESNYKSVLIQKSYDASFTLTTVGESASEYIKRTQTTTQRAGFTQSDLDYMNNNSLGLKFAGIIDLGAYTNTTENVNGYSSQAFTLSNLVLDSAIEQYYCLKSVLGFSNCGEQFLLDNGFTRLAGNYPQTANEIAIPKYVFELYSNSGIYTSWEQDSRYKTPEDIINVEIQVGKINLKIVGVYDVGEIPEKYKELLNPESKMDYYSKLQLTEELKDYLTNSFHSIVFVTDSFYDAHKYDNIAVSSVSRTGFRLNETPLTVNVNKTYTFSCFTEKSIWKYDYLLNLYDKHHNEIEFAPLEENDIYLPAWDVISLPGYSFWQELASRASEFPELVDLYTKKSSNAYKFSVQEIERFIELLFPAYKTIQGEDLTLPDKYYAKNYLGQEIELNVKGYFIFENTKNISTTYCLLSDSLIEKYSLKNENTGQNSVENYQTSYAHSPSDEKYGSIITLTDNTLEQSYFMLQGRNDGTTYEMQNAIYETTGQMANLINQMKLVFYIAGALFGIFAALMLFNFISVSISSKSKEIGILRAVGARKQDVFKIFFIEALLITLACFAVSAVVSGLVCNLINTYSLQNALKIILLNYSFINVLILFGISSLVSVLATIIPVTKAANKSPVESIRSL